MAEGSATEGLEQAAQSAGTRVLVVDDHPMVREGLRGVLGATPDFVCVGEASNGMEAVEYARRLQPDLIVMDLHMPKMDGIAATQDILAELPETVVVVLTMYEQDASVMRALNAGARGYLVKGATHGEIVQTLRTVSAGGLVISGAVATGFVHRLASGGRPSRPFPQLSDRETEVLELLVTGLRDHRIAEQLGIEPKTVRNHIASILGKTGARDRAEVVVRVKETGEWDADGPVTRC